MPVTVDSFRQAKHYYVGRNKPVRVIVLHSMETGEALTDAEAVGNYFAGPNAPRASAHVGVDADSTVGYVRDGDTAFGAAGANADGFHIEQSGRARQSREEWLDARSRATIRRAAKAGYEASIEFGIPRVRLSMAQVADGATKGFTDHDTVSKAFPAGSSGHWDPGPHYPWDVFLADMEALASPSQGDLDMTPGQCRDKVGRKWFFIVGDHQELQASVAGGAFFPIGGIWTSGCDAMTEDDGRIVITGRAADGQLQQCIVYTDGNTVKPPGTAPEFELLGGHLYPPG